MVKTFSMDQQIVLNKYWEIDKKKNKLGLSVEKKEKLIK